MVEKIYIKNMVCDRCIRAVVDLLDDLNIAHEAVILGEVELKKELTTAQKVHLQARLSDLGFELIDDRKSQLIEQIKVLLVQQVQNSEGEPRENLSDYLTQNLHHDYSYLSNFFSAVEGITIEKYFIALKIEKAKELLVYGELSLSEIAYRMGYSSVAHLSSQFKKVTRLTPSRFKQIKSAAKRVPIDEVGKEP
mgnify:CR=1 FL=1